MMTWIILGYLAFGLLLMTYMCPCWHPFEWLIGAIIWPISAVIGIVVVCREAKQPDLDTTLLVLELGAIMLLAQEAARKAAEEANQKKVLDAQAPQ